MSCFSIPIDGLVQIAAANHVHEFAAEKLHNADAQLRSHTAEKRHVGQAFATFPLRDRFVGYIQSFGQLSLRKTHGHPAPADKLSYF